MKLVSWIALIWLIQFSTAGAASFDCAKAQSKVEHLICDNPELSKLDEDLSKAYSVAQGRSEDKQKTIQEQREWLKGIRNICLDANCLRTAYVSRIDKLSNTRTMPKLARKAAKHAKQKNKAAEEFEPFAKEREFLDDPYEVASPEAEELLLLINKLLLSEKAASASEERHREWAKEFIEYLRQGHGDYLKISDGVYIVQSYFQYAYLSGIWVADAQHHEFRQLASAYSLEVIENGFLPDGTGWILAGYGGLSHGTSFEGNYLITFFSTGQEVGVTSTRLIAEDYGYSEDKPALGSYEYWCGPKENRIGEIAGRIQGREWNDINHDGQDELIINVEEKSCREVEKPSIKRRLVFSISKGQVSELH